MEPKDYPRKIYQCNNKKCTLFEQQFEKYFDPYGNIEYLNELLTCPQCGTNMQMNVKATFGEPHFNIDLLALGTKRFFERGDK